MNSIIQKLNNKHNSLKKYTDWAILGHVTQNLEFWFQCRKCAPKIIFSNVCTLRCQTNKCTWLALAMSIRHVHEQRKSSESFFSEIRTFWAWADKLGWNLGGILAISSQNISTILALWVPCSWESVAGSFSYKKCWFLSLKHITPKYSQNKILAIKNMEKNLRTSVFGGCSIVHFISDSVR